MQYRMKPRMETRHSCNDTEENIQQSHVMKYQFLHHKHWNKPMPSRDDRVSTLAIVYSACLCICVCITRTRESYSRQGFAGMFLNIA